ncbi:MAG: lactate dehydrogenase, partial [Bacteroidota bacterium]
MKVLITTVPFASVDNTPMKLMESEGIQIDMNPLGRKLKESELAEIIESYDALIAGTDPIGKKVFAKAKNLKLISRVGIGLDSVDLIEARRRGIAVTYTPEAPAPAVAEFTIGLMIALLRQIHVSNIAMRKGEWYR